MLYFLGAERLVQHLHRHSVPVAIATGSSDTSYQQKIQRHQELFNLFNHVVCSGTDPEVKHGKPAPDCFLVAAKRFPDQPPPSSVRYLLRCFITVWFYYSCMVASLELFALCFS